MYCPRCGSTEVASKDERMADVRHDVAQRSEKPLATALVGPLVEKVAEFFGAEWTKNRCRKCGHTWR
jgi:predicted nucleic-acid-binding Zn-ribbon protein